MKLSTKFLKENGWYIARCPELRVTTQGRTLKEAKRNLKEAMEVHLEAMVDYMIKHGQVTVEKGQIISIKR